MSDESSVNLSQHQVKSALELGVNDLFNSITELSYNAGFNPLNKHSTRLQDIALRLEYLVSQIEVK